MSTNMFDPVTSSDWSRSGTQSLSWRKLLIRTAFWLQHPETLREIELIQSLERSSPKAIRAVQQERLIKLLQFAWSQTDYYREVLESCGAVRNGKVNLDRFEDIPFLTKDIIRSQTERLRPKALPRGRKAHINQSGGSTGEPTKFWQDDVYWAVTIATRTYHFSLAGKNLGEREMKIWGSERDLLKGTLGWRANLENWLYNRKFEQCWHLPEKQILKIIRDMDEWKPKLLWCYRDGIDAVARYITQHGIRVQSPGAIILGGATVYPFMAKQIEGAFRAPVMSAYGSREVGALACQCLQRQGHHIAAQSHVVEAIGSGGHPVMEQDGELAITPLMNYAMPFIRYRIGDRGRLTSRLCACGRGFPLLDSLSGRIVEALSNEKGEQVDPLYFIQMMSEVLGGTAVRKGQLIQEKDNSLTMNVVLEAGATAAMAKPVLDQMRQKIAAIMGAECPVRFAFVGDIPLSASGKYPYVIRRTALPHSVSRLGRAESPFKAASTAR
jgi:phenylacetate-CoA ligase